MRLEGIRAGDIVEVDRLGRRFHALVDGSADGGLTIQPLDRRVTYRTCRPHEVRAHWARRGRPRMTSEPLEPSPDQLELDTAVGDPPAGLNAQKSRRPASRSSARGRVRS